MGSLAPSKHSKRAVNRNRINRDDFLGFELWYSSSRRMQAGLDALLPLKYPKRNNYRLLFLHVLFIIPNVISDLGPKVGGLRTLSSLLRRLCVMGCLCHNCDLHSVVKREHIAIQMLSYIRRGLRCVGFNSAALSLAP